MKNIVLFDTRDVHCACLPITFTRAVSDVRVGILTIKEKWQHYIPGDYTALTAEYLAVKYPALPDEALFIAGNLCPDAELLAAVTALTPGVALLDADARLLAFCGTCSDMQSARYARTLTYTGVPVRIAAAYDIFRENGRELEKDFRLLTAGAALLFPEEQCLVEAFPVPLEAEPGEVVDGEGKDRR